MWKLTPCILENDHFYTMTTPSKSLLQNRWKHRITRLAKSPYTNFQQFISKDRKNMIIKNVTFTAYINYWYRTI